MLNQQWTMNFPIKLIPNGWNEMERSIFDAIVELQLQLETLINQE